MLINSIAALANTSEGTYLTGTSLSWASSLVSRSEVMTRQGGGALSQQLWCCTFLGPLLPARPACLVPRPDTLLPLILQGTCRQQQYADLKHKLGFGLSPQHVVCRLV